MVIYTREEKTLIIPEGLGSSMSCEEQYREGYDNGYQSGYTEGYAEGQADCSGGTGCNLQAGEMFMSSGWPGSEIVTPSQGYDGFNSVEITDDGYGEAKYNEGYSNGYNDGASDCSTAIEQAYESGYTAGQADCPECSGGTCNLENGQLELGRDWDGNDTIYPSAGYDGFGSVQITDNGYGNEKYQSGYTQGYNDGQGGGCNLQDKSVNQNTNLVTYNPDAGYDGMRTITVDATGVYTNGHNDGQNYARSLMVSSAFTENGTYTRAEGWNSVTINVQQSDCSSAITEAYESGYTQGYQSGYTQGQAECPECDCTEECAICYQQGYTDGRQSVTSGCPMQSKSVRMDNIETTVTPDNGYVGLDSVYINAEDVYNDAYSTGYTEGYQSGYTAGQQDCSGSSCNLTETWIDLMDGDDFEGQGVDYYVSAITPNYDGWYKVHIQDKDYGQSKYDEGYADGQAACSGGTPCDCSSAITEAYQSGYTEGYADAQAEYPQGTMYNAELDSGWTGLSDILPGELINEIVITDNGYGDAKYNAGYDEGEQVGFDNGYGEGYQSGYTEGYNEGVTANCGTAIDEAYQSGFTAGEGEIHTLEVVIKTENNYYTPLTGAPRAVFVLTEGEGVDAHTTPYDPANIIEGDGVSEYVGTYDFETKYSSNPDLYYFSQIYDTTAKTLTLCFKGYLYNNSGVYPQPIYACPSSLGVDVMESNINNWGNWSVETVRFNGRPLYDNNGGLSKIGNGGFKLKPTYYGDNPAIASGRRNIFMTIFS